MRGATLYNLSLAVVVFAFLLVAMAYFVTSFELETQVSLSPEVNTLITQQREAILPLEAEVKKAEESLQNIQLDNPLAYIIGAGAIVGVLTSILRVIPAVMITTVTGISAFFGIPTWVTSFILTFVTIAIVFSVLSWLYGRRMV